MAAPVQLAAIDAGSNAIRLVIARATSPKHIEMLDCERAAVRLGHNAFTRRVISGDTISRAARAFRQIRTRILARLQDPAIAQKCSAIAKRAPYIARSDAPPAHSPDPIFALANPEVPLAEEFRFLPTTVLPTEFPPHS